MTGMIFNEVMRLDSNGNLGIGTASPKTSITNTYSEWFDILEAAEKNPAVKIALEKLRTTYYLSKQDGSET